jgi:hypothetical protein
VNERRVAIEETSKDVRTAKRKDQLLSIGKKIGGQGVMMEMTAIKTPRLFN